MTERGALLEGYLIGIVLGLSTVGIAMIGAVVYFGVWL